jgi:hypothetical protein
MLFVFRAQTSPFIAGIKPVAQRPLGLDSSTPELAPEVALK